MAGDRRSWVASRTNPAPGGPGKGPGLGLARFAQMFSPVDQSKGHRGRLSYLEVQKCWIVVETPRHPVRIGRNRCGTVCPGIVDFGSRPGPTRPRVGLGMAPASTWPGPCSICTHVQPGRPILKQSREVSRLSHLAISKFWSVFETPRNLSRIIRNRCGRTGHRRFWAASRPNPAPGRFGKGPGRGTARFGQMFSTDEPCP